MAMCPKWTLDRRLSILKMQAEGRNGSRGPRRFRDFWRARSGILTSLQRMARQGDW